MQRCELMLLAVELMIALGMLPSRKASVKLSPHAPFGREDIW